MDRQDPQTYLPLTPLWFQILLAVSREANHGYGILKEIEERAGSEFKLATGPIYLALQRLTEQGLVSEQAPTARDGDARRKYYKITAIGKRVAILEAQRLAGLVGAAIELDLLDADDVARAVESR